MLKWDALERPSMIKLKQIFQDSKDDLKENFDNKGYVDELIERVMKMEDSEILNNINEAQEEEKKQESEDSYDEEEDIQFTEQIHPPRQQEEAKDAETKDIVNDLDNQIDQFRL